MLSRVAENIYWMARYLERVEDTACLINNMTNLLLDLPQDAEVEWFELVKVIGAEDKYDELYHDKHDETSVMKFLISDKRNPSAIINFIVAARENARTTRDIIPNAMWEQINELYHYAKENAKNSISRRKRNAFMSKLIRLCQTLTGITMGALPHDDAYRFLRVGRNLERADMISRIIDVAAAKLLSDEEVFNPAFATVRWISVLKSLNAFQAYRQQGLIGITGDRVLEYLLQNGDFPRSISHSLQEVSDCLGKIKKSQKPRRTIAKMTEELQNVSTKKLKRSALHKFVDQFQMGICELHDEIADIYFRYE